MNGLDVSVGDLNEASCELAWSERRVLLYRPSSTDIEGIPCNAVPNMIGPFIFGLEKQTVSIKGNFLAKSKNVVRGYDLVTKRYLDGKVAKGQRIRDRAFRRMQSLLI